MTVDLTDAWACLRRNRDVLLARSDWTQLADAPSWLNKAAWATYRQALRDLPANTADPTAITWPTAPQSSQGYMV